MKVTLQGRDNRSVDVDSPYAEGGLAITPSWSEVRGICLDSWNVTHVASGRSLVTDFPSQAFALAALQRFLVLADWEKVSVEDATRMSDVRDQVSAIAKDYLGQL